MVIWLALNGGAVFAALVLARALGLGGRLSRLLLGALGGYLIIVHSLVLVAGLVGHLTVGGVGMLLAAVMAAALWLARRPRPDHASVVDEARFTAAALFAPLAATASGVIWAWPHLFQATRLWIWDDYTYHMVYPVLWLREHAIAAATPAQAFTMQAWYPLSASLVSVWFMLPFPGARGEALAWVSLTGLLYAGVVASGAAELLARLGCARGAWAVPIVLFATSHRITVMASSFSDADLAQAAALFGAFVFAVPRAETERPGDVGVDALYALLLSGFALGVKVSAALPALTILAMLALRATSGLPAARAVARMGLAVAVSWAATGAYWYARNLVRTGNPVYPAAFLVWPGATFPETTLLEYSRRYGLRRAMIDALAVYANWPVLHAGLATIGLVGLAGWLVFHRRSMTRPQRYFAGGTLVITAAILIALPAAPYSAGNSMTFHSGFVHWDSMRYIALLPILGWVALGFLLDAGADARAGRTFAAVCITIAGLLTSGIALLSSRVTLLALAVGAALLARVPVRAGAWPAYAIRHQALAVSALAMAGLLVWSHGTKVVATAASFYVEPLFGSAAAVLDRQSPGTRVAIFGDQWVYPTFGDRHHLRPVRLDSDGRVATAPIGDAFDPGDLTVDPATFRSNLRASGVGVVVVVHLPHPGRSAEWPTQQAALEASGDARLVYQDRAVAIWKLGS